MKKIIIAIIMILFTVPAYASITCTLNGSACTTDNTCDTCTASTCSRTDIQAAATKLARGGTVNVAAGSCTWTDPVSVDKALTIKGAGVGNTNITSGLAVDAHVIQYNPTSPASDANLDFKVTGFTFNLGGSSAVFIRTTETTVVNKVSIVNNSFLQCGYDCMQFIGNFYGVIGGNYFTRPATAEKLGGFILISGHSGSAMWNAINENVTGTAKNMFIEDNYFNEGTNPVEKIPIGSSGSSFVFRYNTIQYNTNMFTYGGDTHGCQLSWSWASRGSEYYGNKFILDGSGNFQLFSMRGAKNMNFNNRVMHTQNLGREVSLAVFNGYPETCATSYACPGWTLFPGDNVCSQDGRPQGVYDSYMWNNRYGYGSTQTIIPAIRQFGFNPVYYADNVPAPTIPSASGAYPPRTNVDFWADYLLLNETSTSNTTRMGCGTYANRPATCTAGDGYWATNQSCSEVPSGAYGQNPTTPIAGTLYRCGTGNTWTAYYTPYTYPHPLRSGAAVDIYPPQLVYGSTIPEPSASPIACSSSPTNVPIGFTVTDDSPPVVCKGCIAGVGGCAYGTTYSQMVTMDQINYTNTNMVQTATIPSLCDSSPTIYSRCIDALGNYNSEIPMVNSYTMAGSEPTGYPTLSTQVLAADGRTLTLTFSEAVTFGAGGSAGWTLLVDAEAYEINYASGVSSATLTYQSKKCIPSTASTVTLAYTQPTGGVIDTTGLELASITSAVSVTNSSTMACSATTSLFEHGASVPPGGTDTSYIPLELGVRFSSSTVGQFEGVRFWKSEANTGTHIGNIWCVGAACGVSGSNVATVTFADETASGWQYQAFDEPVPFFADCEYIVSYYNPTGAWTYVPNFWYTGYENGDLSTFTSGADYAGRYAYSSASAFPASSFRSNYLVDVEVSYEAGATHTVTTSKVGTCSTIDGDAVVNHGDTVEIGNRVNNGWKILVGGTCPVGSGVWSGNDYTWTTGAVVADCTVVATCAEKKIVPWLAP